MEVGEGAEVAQHLRSWCQAELGADLWRVGKSMDLALASWLAVSCEVASASS